MKRPELEYAENCTLIHTYARKLEEYCDYLEAIISKGDCITHYEKEIQRLEKALDKACEVIVELNDCTNLISEEYLHCPFGKKCNDTNGHFSICVSNKENWKEWLLDEER